MNDQKQLEETIGLLEKHLRDGDFTFVDEWLSNTDLTALSDASIVGALTITYWGKGKLAKRDEFLQRAEDQLIIHLGKERAEKLLERRR